MGFKRKRFGTKSARGSIRKGKRKTGLVGSSLKRLSKRVNMLTRTLETKSGVQTFSDGLELGHNRINLYSSSILSTLNGTSDNEDASGRRIGDKITLSSVQVKGMVELNERYSDVSIKVMVIKSAKGDVPTDDNIWQGASTNKLLDTFNTERFTILKSKFIKLKAPNMSIIASGTQTVGSGFTAGTPMQSRATKMFSISIPGKKFGRRGVIQYENMSTQPKFFDYHFIMFAYSNWSTSATLGFYVARVNDAFVKLHYKDA